MRSILQLRTRLAPALTKEGSESPTGFYGLLATDGMSSHRQYSFDGNLLNANVISIVPQSKYGFIGNWFFSFGANFSRSH